MESLARPIPGFLARIRKHSLSPAPYRSACPALHRALVYRIIPRTSEPAAADRKYLGNLLALQPRCLIGSSKEFVEELLPVNCAAGVSLGNRCPQRHHL